MIIRYNFATKIKILLETNTCYLIFNIVLVCYKYIIYLSKLLFELWQN